MSSKLMHESPGILGFGGGMVASMMAVADTQGLQQTALYALVGAVVSFVATLLCKWCWKLIKRKTGDDKTG